MLSRSVYKVRKVPNLMLEPLKLEIDRLVRGGIEEIESSEWLAPILLAVKDGGKQILPMNQDISLEEKCIVDSIKHLFHNPLEACRQGCQTKRHPHETVSSQRHYKRSEVPGLVQFPLIIG